MRLLDLELRDFRNHHAARAPLEGESALLLGENGSGKTNWIEAAVLLSIGRSFRGSRDRDLVRRGAECFDVRGSVQDQSGIRVDITARGSSQGSRDVRVDGAALPRLAELLGRFPTVHFSVEDVAQLNGSPAGRRRFLDVALCQLEPVYVGYLRDYQSAVRQRNRLLAEERGGRDHGTELSVWEEILARSGVELDLRRGNLTRQVDGVLRELAGALGLGVEPEIGYPAGDITVSGAEAVEHRVGRLEVSRPRDRHLGWTSEGPHRATVLCRMAGRDLTEGASRGMARLYSILLRLALSRVLEERLKEAPVLFLDDPESELDPRWIGPLLGLVPESTQTVVTACRPL
ncbi:MAG TPA: DNA replication and repair protein RecF, partial [Candidatus Eisenbacteria bacterium]|nr:DNA replication and repair protein RecF [Candidatus Eisenbacteria bacterium]